jgi:Raf kinase inhibitor-like YbhB/YbcL family protein
MSADDESGVALPRRSRAEKKPDGPRRTRSVGSTVVGVVLLVSLAGCGGDDERAASTTTTVDGAKETGMQLTSPAFDHDGEIPVRFTCDGDDVSPPLTLGDVPAAAVALVVIMDDPDAPGGTWDHWVEYDIAPLGEIPEDAGPLGMPGENSWGRTGYGGPCPPDGEHRYFFTVYALGSRLDLPAGADKAAVLDAIEGKVLDEATLMGRYRR